LVKLFGCDKLLAFLRMFAVDLIEKASYGDYQSIKIPMNCSIQVLYFLTLLSPLPDTFICKMLSFDILSDDTLKMIPYFFLVCANPVHIKNLDEYEESEKGQ